MTRLIPFVCLIMTSGIKGQSTHQDCNQSQLLCQYGNVNVSEIEGSGNVQDIIKTDPCGVMGIRETNSHWFKWQSKSYGYFSFIISPFQEEDDYDFVLYSSTSDGCLNKEGIRCMFSGNIINSKERHCDGITGLRLDALDVCEYQGCNDGSDNFLKIVEAEPGVTYYLFINNFNSSAGFDLFFEGNAELENDLSCKQSDSDVSLFLSPNPVMEELTVQVNNPEGSKCSLNLITPSGSLLKTYNIDEGKRDHNIQVDVSTLSPGSHFIRIETENEVLLKHFVKI